MFQLRNFLFRNYKHGHAFCLCCLLTAQVTQSTTAHITFSCYGGFVFCVLHDFPFHALIVYKFVLNFIRIQRRALSQEFSWKMYWLRSCENHWFIQEFHPLPRSNEYPLGLRDMRRYVWNCWFTIMIDLFTNCNLLHPVCSRDQHKLRC